ncbi:MAG: DUF3108 domain-containing protein [Gemmatimonadetes bacterium]|nr:DUF3108 domain-containing protein [Gemmatimonadota bacterium]
MIALLVSLTSLLLPAECRAPGAECRTPKHPFAVGELFEYSAKIGMLKLGEASIRVAGLDTVRGEPTYKFRFQLEGGNFLFRIKNTLESWTTVTDFKSLRFRNDNTENNKNRLRDYDIFPDSGFYRQRGKDGTQATPTHPLDDASLLYFVRTTPLEVGKAYRFENYFMDDKNPLLIRVLKMEEMDLPDGTKVRCFVLNPVIDDRGMFADRAEARLWITDDARRIPVQIRSKLAFGTVTLRLAQMTFAPAD